MHTTIIQIFISLTFFQTRILGLLDFRQRKIEWNTYKPQYLKSATADFYTHSWDTNIMVPMSHALWRDRPEEIRDRSLSIYVRKFSNTLTPRNHIWLISGGPGSPTSGIEKALSLQVKDTAVYLMDNRGLGRSERLSQDSNSQQCIANPRKCYNNLPFPSYVISMHETAKDYNYISKLIQSDEGGNFYLYGSSYGATLAYYSFQYSPHLYSGILLEAFVPKFRLNEAGDVRKYVVDSCQKSDYCRSRFPLSSKVEAEDLMRLIMSDETDNPCKRTLQFISEHSYQPLYSTLNSHVRYALYSKKALKAALLPFLYDLAYCPSVNKFTTMYREIFSKIHDAEATEDEISDDLLHQNNNLHCTSKSSKTDYFFGGHIRFSEFSYDSIEKVRLCRERKFLNVSNWADVCGMISDYKVDFEPFLYAAEEPEPSREDLRTSQTRVLIFTGKWDTQTPHDLAQEEFDRLNVPHKYIFTADHGGHGVIEGTDVPNLGLDLVISFLMTGNEKDLRTIRAGIEDHNNQPDRIFKTWNQEAFKEQNIWDFKAEEREYSWMSFGMVLLGTFIPPILTVYGFLLKNTEF